MGIRTLIGDASAARAGLSLGRILVDTEYWKVQVVFVGVTGCENGGMASGKRGVFLRLWGSVDLTMRRRGDS